MNAPNKALEHAITRLHALTGGILVPPLSAASLNLEDEE
jgi:hypothetical protein